MEPIVIYFSDITEEQYNYLDTARNEMMSEKTLFEEGEECGLSFWYDEDGLNICGENEHLIDIFGALCYSALEPNNAERAAMALWLMMHDDISIPTK